MRCDLCNGNIIRCTIEKEKIGQTVVDWISTEKKMRLGFVGFNNVPDNIFRRLQQEGKDMSNGEVDFIFFPNKASTNTMTRDLTGRRDGSTPSDLDEKSMFSLIGLSDRLIVLVNLNANTLPSLPLLARELVILEQIYLEISVKEGKRIMAATSVILKRINSKYGAPFVLKDESAAQFGKYLSQELLNSICECMALRKCLKREDLTTFKTMLRHQTDLLFDCVVKSYNKESYRQSST